ncbi:hypothetical protein QJQ45_028854, partial [Haematococcus lacustris]
MDSQSTTSCDDLVEALETFFCSPGFTSAVGTYMSENASNLSFVATDETQPIENYNLFLKYQSLIEEHLSIFLVDRGLSAQASNPIICTWCYRLAHQLHYLCIISTEVYEVCQAAQGSQVADSLACLDYLVAASEYEAFMELARDHYEMALYDAGTDMESSSQIDAAQLLQLDQQRLVAGVLKDLHGVAELPFAHQAALQLV